MDKIIIEVRVNEYASRVKNAHVPWLPQEIAADAKASYDEGATIIHYHGRAADGAPNHDPNFYKEANAKIRAACPILIHPTLGYATLDATAEERFAAMEDMCADPATKPDFAPMDMGSVNVDWYDPDKVDYDTTDLIYRNSTGTLMHFGARIKALGLKPYLVSWNVSFTRQMIAFMDMGIIPEPAYVCFCLTDGIMLAGHPGTPEGLDAHTVFLPKDKRTVWTVVNFNGDLLLLTEKIIREGGHISIGLGDYPYAEHGAPTNAALIARVVKQARAMGREVANLEETKEILGMAA